MAYQLNTFVHVVERDGKGEVVRTGQFGPSEDLPAWAVKAITNPDVWDGEPPAHARGGQQPATPTPASDGGGDAVGVPPKSGAGSGKDAWAAYAQGKGVTIPDSADRGEIIAALEAAGVPTTPPQE